MTRLYGYGPHTVAANDDYDIACVGAETRPQLLTIGLHFGTSPASVAITSRAHGGADAFVSQAYIKPDGTTATAALSGTDTHVQIDCTGKDIRLTTTGGNANAMTWRFGLSSEL